jgi:uncharacterized protein (DUF2132 family)
MSTCLCLGSKFFYCDLSFLGLLSLCMNKQHNKTPLEGVTLEQMVSNLFEHYGWDSLGKRIAIRCFTTDPSLKSSLAFLRKTPWARKKVENLYLTTQKRGWKDVYSK